MTRARALPVLAAVALALPAAAPALPAPPPRATVSAGSQRVVAALGSYCWRTACVDMIPPQQRSDIPRLTVQRGGTVRIALRFRAAVWSVAPFGAAKGAALRPGTSATFRARSAGIFAVSVTRSASGSASYLFRVALR